MRAPRPRSTTWQQVKSFAVIGILSTVAYVVLFAILRGTMSAALANATALLITAIGNTAANRRLTFGVRGSAGMARHQFGGLVAFAVALVITSASIGVLYAVSPHPARIVEVSVLVAANVLATVVRFLLLRQWIDRPTRGWRGAPDPIEAVEEQTLD
jgi:putative flippase GtrA